MVRSALLKSENICLQVVDVQQSLIAKIDRAEAVLLHRQSQNSSIAAGFLAYRSLPTPNIKKSRALCRGN